MTWIETEDRCYEELAAARREGFLPRRVAHWHWQNDSETRIQVCASSGPAGRPAGHTEMMMARGAQLEKAL